MPYLIANFTGDVYFMKLVSFLIILTGIFYVDFFSAMQREETEPDFTEIMSFTSERNARTGPCDISDSEGKQYVQLIKIPGRSKAGNYIRYSLKTSNNEHLHLIKMVSGQHANTILIQRGGYQEDFTDKSRKIIDQADALLPNN